MDVNKLLKALDNENNELIFNYTTNKLHNMTIQILKELHLDKNELNEYFVQLKQYRYVDEINNLKYGTYLRWICLINTENFKLSKGAIFCNIKITDNGVYLICKGFNNRHFKIKMDECLLFQKLTNQEIVLLNALDYLSV
jgi:hypothetical protein